MINEIPHEYEEIKQEELRINLSVILVQMHCKGITKEAVTQWIDKDFKGFEVRGMSNVETIIKLFVMLSLVIGVVTTSFLARKISNLVFVCLILT